MFKVGDKVKCVQAGFSKHLIQDGTYTVSHVRGTEWGGFLVRLQEVSDPEAEYFYSRFEAVEEVCRSPYCECDPDKCREGKVDMRGTMPEPTTVRLQEPVRLEMSLVDATKKDLHIAATLPREKLQAIMKIILEN